MMAQPQARVLSGDRLHLHHGPIDLIIGVDGPQRETCFAAATDRFQTVLTGLVQELPHLRRPVSDQTEFADPIAARMARAVRPYGARFVTPMAAVAGAVADEVLAAMVTCNAPDKAYVNNGGDIALHLSNGTAFTALGPGGEITITAADPVRGIATSGWRGRSHSLGIADAVTVLARSAADADVAATLIANAVDLPGHPAIRRSPASELSPDSDLGERLVTVDVGRLSSGEIDMALSSGRACAQDLMQAGHVLDVILSLQGRIVTLHHTPPIGACAHA